MTTDRDDFDDAATATLLRKWGRDVRETEGGAGAEVFGAPADLARISRRDRFRLSRVRVLLALAAAIALAAGGWWIAQRLGVGRSPQPREIVLGEIALTATPKLLRGDARPTFKSGDTLYVHLHADRDGSAFVALLDARLELVSVTAGSALALDRGANTLGPFVLDDSTGTESIVIIAAEESLAAGTFEAIVKRTGAAVAGGPSGHAERLRDIVTMIAANRDLAVQTASFEHGPR